MSKVVEIIDVNLDDVIGANNTKIARLTYNNGDKEIKKGILHSALKQNPLLAKTVKELKPGDTVELSFDDSQYRNIIAINRTDQKPTPSTFKSNGSFMKKSSTYADNSVGMRVGNALTNVVTTLVAQKKEITVDNVVELGKILLEAGEKLTSIAQQGEVITKDSPDKEKKDPEKKLIDDSNPFDGID